MSNEQTEISVDDTVKERIEEATDSTEDAPLKDQVELKVGYVVGMTHKGNFVFQPHGDDIGLLDLLGLQNIAEERIARLYEQNQGGGDALVGKLVEVVLRLEQKVDILLKAVTPQKKPDNKIS